MKKKLAGVTSSKSNEVTSMTMCPWETVTSWRNAQSIYIAQPAVTKSQTLSILGVYCKFSALYITDVKRMLNNNVRVSINNDHLFLYYIISSNQNVRPTDL